MNIVFFSFKGGVGRSSSLMNVGRELAKRGKDVVIVDLDIAAPGVDIFEGTDLKNMWLFQLDEKYKKCFEDTMVNDKLGNIFKKHNVSLSDKARISKINDGWEIIDCAEKYKIEPVDEKTTKLNVYEMTQKGFVEYFQSMIDEEGMKEKDWNVNTPSIHDYVYPLKQLKGDKWEPYPTEGITYIMRAGNHEQKNYGDNQRKLDTLIGKMDVEIGTGTITGTNFIKILDKFNNDIQKELNPDYVLFDTRPGDSSISIMALQKLADISVLCFNLNAWNFHLINDFYYEMTEEDWYKKYDKKLMPKIVLVVTPVPRYASQFEVFNKRFDEIAHMDKAINPGGTKEIKPIVIPFNEQMATQDTLIRDDPTLIDDPTTRGYIKLANLLISQNPEDIENKIKKAEEGKTYVEVRDEFHILMRNYPHKIEVFHSYGEYLSKMGKYEDAKEILEKAVEKADKVSEMLENNRKIYAGYSRLNFLLGNVYHNLGQINNAFNCFINAFNHDPKNHRAKAMIGDMLLELGDAKKDKYLFNWEKVSGNDSEGLIEFLMQNFNIEWIKTAKINKNEDVRTIRMTNDTNFLSLTLNNEKNNVNIEIDDGRTDKFIVKTENGELNIYYNNYEYAKNIYLKTIEMSKEPDHYNRLGVAYTKLASCIDEIDKYTDTLKKANIEFDNAITRRTDYAEAHYNKGKNLYALGEIMSLKAAHADENMDECLNKRKDSLNLAKNAFSKATDYRDDYFEAYYYLALTLSKMEGSDLGTVLAMTGKTLSGQSDNPEANHLRGDYLIRMAANASPERRKKCLIQACSHFASATTYKKNFKESYFAWGSALTILQKQSELVGDEIESKLESRDAFYKFEQAIALFFDYPDFYFDPDEIDEIVKDTYNFIITLETIFTADEIYNKIKNYAEIRDKGDVKLEPQFENWLNEKELSTLEFSDFYRNLVLKAVFRDFMTMDEKESLEDLNQVPIENIVSLIETITSREEITNMIDGQETIVPSWKDRKAVK